MTTSDTGLRLAARPAWGLMLMACIALLTALRLWSLWANQTDLFFDEAQYWSWSREPAFGYFSKPPLIAWVIGLSTSLCGHAEPCVRLASPLFYAASAIFIYFAAQALYDARIGFWSALIFVTLPGASFSSTLISTDVPLLFFWSVALWGWIRLTQTRHWSWAVLTGVAIGLGMLSKYAMIYFYLCAAVWLYMHPPERWLLRDLGGLALIVIPLLFLAPNIAWNLSHGLATFSHTAANANWTGIPIHPLKALEFFGAQFGVFGPVLFGALIWVVVQALRARRGDADRLLLAFSVPMIVLVTGQAFLSRAHANWAAVAYPAATILVTAALLQTDRRRLFAASLALHLVLFVVISTAPAFAQKLALPGRLDPYGRMLGWKDLASAIRAQIDAQHFATVLTDDRQLTAELLYYLRGTHVDIRSWHNDGPPRDHYQLTRPFRADVPEPVLFVTIGNAPKGIIRRFAQSRELARESISAGPKKSRTITLYALESYEGDDRAQ